MTRDEVAQVKAIAREIAQYEIVKALKDKLETKVVEPLSSTPAPSAPAKIADDKKVPQALNKTAKKH